MFSMSTETVATIPDYRPAETAFLPAAPGVVHEFLRESEAGLLHSRDLEPGDTYEMVVSHRFGLRRYATGDLFRVERFVGSCRTSASSAGAAWPGPSPGKSSPPSR